MASHGTTSHGLFRHGGRTFWTAEAGVVPNAKPDTVFYSSTSAGLEVDLSQKLTDITDGTTYFYESSSTRTNITEPREITVAFEADSGTGAGTLVIRTTAGAAPFRLRKSATWDLQAFHGAVSQQVDFPGSAPAVATRIVFHWSTRPNLLTTGAADAIQHEAWVWRVDTDEREITSWTSAVASSGAGDFVIGASTTAGGDPYPDPIVWVRVGSAFHSTTEAAQDWRAGRTLPTLTAETRLELPATPFSQGVGDDAEFAGPTYLWGASSVLQNEARLFAPLINEIYQKRVVGETETGIQIWETREVAEAPKITSDGYINYESWNVTQTRSDLTDTTVLASYFRRVPIPVGCTGAHVRVWCDFEDNGGTSDMEITCFASTGIPGRGAHNPMTREAYAAIVRGKSERVDLGILPIETAPALTYIYLGFSFDDGTMVANEKFSIHEWVVNPIFDER